MGRSGSGGGECLPGERVGLACSRSASEASASTRADRRTALRCILVLLAIDS